MVNAEETNPVLGGKMELFVETSKSFLQEGARKTNARQAAINAGTPIHGQKRRAIQRANAST